MPLKSVADRPFQKAAKRILPPNIAQPFCQTGAAERTVTFTAVNTGDDWNAAPRAIVERMAELVAGATMWPIVPSPKRLAEIAAEVERMLEHERTR